MNVNDPVVINNEREAKGRAAMKKGAMMGGSSAALLPHRMTAEDWVRNSQSRSTPDLLGSAQHTKHIKLPKHLRPRIYIEECPDENTLNGKYSCGTT